MFPNLNAEITRKGFSTREYAKEIGVCESTARNKLDGKTEFTLPEIEATLRLFPGMTIDYLFSRKGAQG